MAKGKSRSRLTLAEKGAIKAAQAPFIEKIKTARANDDQQAIFAAAQSGRGRYMVLAGPGTGKTFTAVKASTSFTSGSAIYFSYNKKIQIDTNIKLVAIDSRMTATTSHAFGLSCLQAFMRGQCKVDEKQEKYDVLVDTYSVQHWSAFIRESAWRIQTEKLNVDVMRLDAKVWTKMLLHYAQVSLSETTPDALADLVEAFDLTDIQTNALTWSFVATAIPNILQEGIEQFLGPEHLVAFDDMIFYPNILSGVPVRQYDHILVDEAQDTSKASLELIMRACHSNTQLFFIGDRLQCQPAGTMVRLRDGQECPIECIRPGNQVVTFDRRSSAFVKSGTVTDIAARQYTGPLYTITSGEKQSKCTDSHKWLVRWVNTDTPVWITYLMKKGERYRVGQAQLFHAVEGRAQFGLGMRARVERADAAWILTVHKSFEDAIVHEAVTAAKYGLPQVVFNPVWNNAHLTQEAINCIYDELVPLEEKAIHCLNDHGRKIEYPLYTKDGMNGYSDDRKVNSAGERQRQGRTTLFETQACNLISDYMAIPLAPESIRVTHDSLQWQSIKVSIEPYSGTVYSLNVERYHKYIADGLVTCNSIYAFAGAAFDSIDQIIGRLGATELPLRICYRCGSRIVDLANQLGGELISANLHTGNVQVIQTSELTDRLRPGDAVIGRTTKHLVQACLKTLTKGKKAKVLGKNIGESITGTVSRLEAMRLSRGVPALQKDLSNLLEVLEEFYKNEEQGLAESRKNPEMALAELSDKVDTVRAFFEAYISKCRDESLRVENDPSCAFTKTSKDFKLYVSGLFIEDDGTRDFVLFMTAHRSKGGEWENVYIIHCEEFPHPKAKSDRQLDQERNLMYVAVTRAMENLFFVGQPFDDLEVPGYEKPKPLTIISAPRADYLAIYSSSSELHHDEIEETYQDDTNQSFTLDGPVKSEWEETFQDDEMQPFNFTGSDAYGFTTELEVEQNEHDSEDEEIVGSLFSGRHDFDDEWIEEERGRPDQGDEDLTEQKQEEEMPVTATIGRTLAIEILCPHCGGRCADRTTGSLMITDDCKGHTVICTQCSTESTVPLNAFLFVGEIKAREKPGANVANNTVEKRGRTVKRTTNRGPKTKGDVPRDTLQLSLDVRTIAGLLAMHVNRSELFEDLLAQYEPFLEAEETQEYRITLQKLMDKHERKQQKK